MPQAVAFVQSGWLPVLRIGLVVRLGRVVGQLGATAARFAFQAATHRAYIEHLGDPPTGIPVRAGAPGRPASLPLTPRSPLAGTMPGLLGGITYPIKGSTGGRLLSIRSGRSGSEHLVLPCPEVFRVAYAPHRILALALLGGPWGNTARGVLDCKATFAVEGDEMADPHWRVAPAEGLGASHVTVAANLWLSGVGRSAAERVWRSILDPPGAGAAIEAAFPFEWDTLEIEAACIPLPPREYDPRPAMFGYAITSLRWPDPPLGPPPRVEWVAARTVREPGSEGPAEPEGSTDFTRVIAVSDEEAVLEGVQQMDAPIGPSVDVEGDGPQWSNAPEVVRAKPLPAEAGGHRRRSAVVERTNLVSAGAGSRRQTGAAMVQAQAVAPFGGGDVLADRFTRILAMLDGLVADGAISSHAEVAPPRSQAARRGPLAVWAFPEVAVVKGAGVERWYLRSFRRSASSHRDVRRTAMVRSVVVGASHVHWIETEPRGLRDHNHSLVFAQDGATHLTTVITGLLRLAAGRRGVWPNPTALTHLAAAEGRAGVRRAVVWRHAQKAPGEGAVPGLVLAVAPFNRRSALTAILEAASE